MRESSRALAQIIYRKPDASQCHIRFYDVIIKRTRILAHLSLLKKLAGTKACKCVTVIKWPPGRRACVDVGVTCPPLLTGRFICIGYHVGMAFIFDCIISISISIEFNFNSISIHHVKWSNIYFHSCQYKYSKTNIYESNPSGTWWTQKDTIKTTHAEANMEAYPKFVALYWYAGGLTIEITNNNLDQNYRMAKN